MTDATTRRRILGTGLALGALPASRALAQGAAPFKIAILTDMSGILADYSGAGSVASAAMAIEEYGGKVLGRPVELLKGDHLNKPDIGSGIARQWYDDGVAAIFDVGSTAVAMPVQTMAREKDRLVVFTSSASADLTGSACSPNGIHWTFNNYSQALGAVRFQTQLGAKTWYFLTIDYTYGRNVQRDTTAMIEAAGGRVVGATLHGFDTTEFSSSLLAAKASKADVVALATTTSHASSLVKQADEFGIRAGGQKLTPLSITLHDVKAIGLASAQGMIETAPYYWDLNDEMRAFGERYRKRTGKMPNMAQASVHGAVTHYLKAVDAAGTTATAPVIAKMKATPIDDFMTRNGLIRQDGRVIRDMYILQVKSPAESKNEWDLQKLVGTIPGTDAFPPPSPACFLNKA